MNKRIFVAAWFAVACLQTWAQQIKGIVSDAKTQETLIGAVITVEGSTLKAITDVEGCFALDGLKSGKHTLLINYIG